MPEKLYGASLLQHFLEACLTPCMEKTGLMRLLRADPAPSAGPAICACCSAAFCASNTACCNRDTIRWLPLSLRTALWIDACRPPDAGP